MKKEYELIIVGAGPAGITAALYAEYFKMDYLLIEKEVFPRDKICGDALAPIVFKILNELQLNFKIDSSFMKPLGFDFIFSNEIESKKYQTSHSDDSQMYNCKRLNFDHKIFNLISKPDQVFHAKLTKIDKENKHILIERNSSIEEIKFNNLIVATGSGKNYLYDTNKNATNILYASRAYVKTATIQKNNIVCFFNDISPGYFWSFPVGEDEFNTGVFFHTSPHTTNIHKIHMDKLAQFYSKYIVSSHTRFPLRVYPISETTYLPNIVAIGDANHCIDPIFGHGIDTAMLEAREQIISLYTNGRFCEKSPIMNLINNKNETSDFCKTSLQKSSSLDERLTILLKYLFEINNYYSNVREIISVADIALLEKA